MHDLNRLLFIAWEDPCCPWLQMKRKEKLQKKTKHVINTNVQFVTLNNNNKLYTLLNQMY